MSEMKKLLKREGEILDNVIAEQARLRAAVHDKNWDCLMDTMSRVNSLTEDFEQAEMERASLEKKLGASSRGAEADLLAEVRGKLIKAQSENAALGEYIRITREFIQGVIDDALPQSRGAVYSKNGKIVHAKPTSVVFNAMS